ncbi:hypothetical protein [Coralloluteibacterium stylophorae]|uniref:Uncharacterized protein n=1 Tax=Coralloluteibacterium stylophorae TaxID=1776034 RepID=A0A8J8AWD5_9GAMM|nr:hypothetical protein [Coralloluteibacterium stylophorae]MBS7457694.1 hypothetical protein [Coralloluteibacterium stylophorae]
MIEYRVPLEEDVADVAARMSPEDVAELAACGHETPLEVLRQSIADSEFALALCFDGRAEAFFGVSTYGRAPGEASPWMLGTSELVRRGRALVIEGRHWIDVWQSKYRLLSNLVDARHARAVGWLSHLGFSPAQDVDVGGHRFLLMERISRV